MGLLITVLAAIVAVLFTLQNAPPAMVRLGYWQWEASLGLILLLTFSSGILISLIAYLPNIMKKKREISYLNKTLQAVEKNFREKIDSLTPPS